MTADTVNVCETFASIQGESSYAGLTCFFIRLAGCNLRCAYCDTPQAWEQGTDREIGALVEEAVAARTSLVQITGGEPLLQPSFPRLARRLCQAVAVPLLVETNGSCDISLVPEPAVTVLDVKCPGSGEAETLDAGNLERLRPRDEVKYVLTDRRDYEWAGAHAREHDLPRRCAHVLLSPAAGRLDPAELARWMLADGSPVRLQVQLHRVIGLA
jgi:7-carboxy-7-deazaguanine synthase